MRVVGTKRESSREVANVDTVVGYDRLPDLLPSADIVVVTCPLTAETRNLINAAAIAAMKPSVHLVNVARGAIVDEAVLLQALQEGRVGAAGLDVMREEPLSASSPLWTMPNVLITPHKAGETQRLEDGVIDILMDNLARQWRGEAILENQVV
jgi:phosphoglycerate dehydrogenase-like enzyme